MSEIKVRSLKTRNLLIAAIILLVGLSFAGYQVINVQYLPVDPEDNTYIDVLIPQQSTATQIASILKESDLIRSETAFLSFCRRTGYDSKLQAGHFRFSRSQSLKEIVEDIAAGRVVTVSFTIPEGYTVDEIGQLLIQKNICTREDWESAIQKDYSFAFLREVPPGVNNKLEGFLFPDTYRIAENTSASRIISVMLSNFEKVWQESFADQARSSDYSIYDTVTIASMVEKEAAISEERPTISGVIKNRMQRNMPLQIDATVLYALGEHKDLVTLDDLKVDSPYNTYKNLGLPPGPIASPGKDSIQAALNPEQHVFLYYVAKGDGSHYFSKTFEEHLAACARYQ